jgi:hypothetical protein
MITLLTLDSAAAFFLYYDKLDLIMNSDVARLCEIAKDFIKRHGINVTFQPQCIQEMYVQCIGL